MNRVRIGVVGTGWWATQFHIPGLLAYEGCDVVAFADPDPVNLARAASHFGVQRTYPGHEQLLEAGDVDGVVVAVPHAYHYAIARDALDVGVHVLVEKPMVLRGVEAWDLVRRSKENGLHLVVGYTYQFTRLAERARKAVREGEIGRMQLVSVLFASMVESYYRARPDDYRDVFGFPLTGPKPDTYANPAIAGGGQAQTQITHAMGMALWVMGARATEVYAQMRNADLEVDLVDAITYTLDNGAIGTVAATGALQPGQAQQQELRFYGDGGYVLQELLAGTLTVQRNGEVAETPPALTADEVYPAHATARCLVDLIAGGGENRAPAEPAAAVVEFLEAAYLSAREGRPVAVGEVLEEPGSDGRGPP
jgi:predicted dehydrogenase